ncbi:MAG: hypothetical protein IJ761_04460 [Bacteroidales bacterium]|nr:hypothetical protein [Bacteroidales bacterium]
MTNNTVLLLRRVLPVVATDLLLIALACLIPALSHLSGIALYRFNPMLLLLLVGMLMGRGSTNGLLLAVLMPLASAVMVGMPAGAKVVCMVAELATIAAAYGWLSHRVPCMWATLAAIAMGKGVYYALKALLLPQAVLVGTSPLMQIGAAVVWATLFVLLQKRVR